MKIKKAVHERGRKCASIIVIATESSRKRNRVTLARKEVGHDIIFKMVQVEGHCRWSEVMEVRSYQ
jgi:hypothetical protein